MIITYCYEGTFTEISLEDVSKILQSGRCPKCSTILPNGLVLTRTGYDFLNPECDHVFRKKPASKYNAWRSDTRYKVGDEVDIWGSRYLCVANHTSIKFGDDLMGGCYWILLYNKHRGANET